LSGRKVFQIISAIMFIVMETADETNLKFYGCLHARQGLILHDKWTINSYHFYKCCIMFAQSVCSAIKT